MAVMLRISTTAGEPSWSNQQRSSAQHFSAIIDANLSPIHTGDVAATKVSNSRT